MKRRRRSACVATVITSLSTALAAGLVTSCGGPEISVSNTDPRYEFEVGRREFERRHWVDSQTHLKRFLNLSPGHAVADSAQLLVGRALFESKSFAEAAVEFAILGREYPRSTLRDEAGYYECLSYSKQMRSPQLDPTFATRSQTCLSELLLRFPDTRFKPDIEARQAEIIDLLAEKEYRLGVLFAKMKRPEAARLYLDGLLKNYPTSRWAAPAILWIGRSQEQKGQFGDALTSYQRVADGFPDHPAGREARERRKKLLDKYPSLQSAPADSGATP
jgi:outer membrane protein assembly factor BamD